MVQPLPKDLQAELDRLTLQTRFTLGSHITPLQEAFLERHGFLIFNQVASQQEVQRINQEVDNIIATWVAEDRKEVFGIPLFKGMGLNGETLIQRTPFSSVFSEYIGNFLRDSRFEPIRCLIGENTRIGHQEKDGCVVNSFINVPGSVYPKLGWHTDGLRDIFYLRRPKRMLNVGLHLTDCPASNGGLRILPGSHHQGFLSMCFRKPYFVYHRPDRKELAIETKAGDLTIHDGRLWHRVQQSPYSGPASFRRSMYVPFLTDEEQHKDEESKTPFYHHLGRVLRAAKLARHRRRS